MKELLERCAGMDVHKKSVTLCALTPEGGETRTFGTMTPRLLEMIEWLQSKEVRSVAMESTGPYWKPIYNMLEERGFEILLANAHHVKNVPGRKTDVKDAEWLAELYQHGLLKGSFVPSRDQRELRELTRYRRSLVDEHTREVNRIQKVLEGGNIKLGDVATDIMGKSGRAMLKALVAGETDAAALAELARGRLKNKHAELEEALQGAMGPHQRMMLKMQFDHIENLERHIEELNREVAERMRPFDELIGRIDEIDGVARRTAEEVLAEIGVDMSRFPSAAHLASWAGISPGNHESAGKRKSGRTSKGNPHLRRALVQAAHAAARTRNTYFSAQYKRLAARRGSKRAAVAVGHSMLITMYHLIKDGVHYHDLGSDHFDKINEHRTVKNAIQRLEALGYTVSLSRETTAA